ncbi:MAG: gliding motility-associated C-terminal domain-containing protein [Saprospiraceae bacterium]|nr:gliding motility-associated C-terminal domain-containing protein [Saprospiraceae bacterium]
MRKHLTQKWIYSFFVSVSCLLFFLVLFLGPARLNAQNTPCAAVSLPNNMTAFQTYSTVGMTNSGVPDPGCAASISVDIWFSVVIPASGDLDIATLPGTMSNAAMALYLGPCNNLSLIACTADDNCGNTIMPIMQFDNLIPGQTYFIRIWPEGAGGTFQIRLTNGDPVAPPINMQPVGSAIQTAANCIQLTSSATGQSGCAWQPAPVDFTQPFTNTMVLNFGTVDANGADGICMVYQNDPAGLSACGVTGGSIGAGGILNSFIIEFDTWDNGAAMGDVPQDHISVDVNGNIGPPINGPAPLPNIEDGQDHTVSFTWNPVGNSYTISFDGVTYLSGSYDIINNCFGGLTTGYCGFTASTGGSTNVQSICTAGPPVYPAGSETEVDVTICQGESYFAGGGFQTTTGTYFDFFFSSNGCDSTILTHLTVSPNSMTNLTEAVCSGDCVTVAGTTYCNSGFYTEVVPNAYNCDSTIFLNLIVLDPSAVIIPSGNIDCSNPIVFLDGTASNVGPGMQYQWTGPSPGCIFGSSTQPIITVSCGGEYTLTVTHSSGNVSCSATTTVMVNIDFETIEVDIVEPDTIDCLNDCITLDASNSTNGSSYNYNWSGPNFSSTELSPVVCDSGLYTLIISNPTNGCMGISGVFVSSEVSQLDADAGPDMILNCFNPGIDLDGSNSSGGPGISVQWYDPGNQPLGTDPVQSVGAGGNYVIEILDASNGCSAFDTVFVGSDFTTPVSDAGPDFTLDCTGDPVLLDGSNSDQGINIILEWLDPNGMVIGNDPNISVTESGIYELVATNQTSGCSDTSQVEVFQDLNAPVADAGIDQILNCDVSALTLNGSNSSTGPNIVYNWQDAIGTSLGTALTLNVNEAGSYYFIVENLDNNCIDTALALVSLDTISPLAITGPDSILTCFSPQITLGDDQNIPPANWDFEWLNEQGSPIGNNPTQEVNTPGIYTLNVLNTDNGCSASSEVLIDEDTVIPQVDPGPDGALTCIIANVDLDGSNSAGGPGIIYSWSDSNGNILGNNPILNVNQIGDYTLVVENTLNGCIDSAQVQVIENIAIPDIEAGLDNTINCSIPSLNLEGVTSLLPDDFEVIWSDDGGVFIDDSLVILVNAPGTYFLEITDINNGCTNLDSLELIADFTQPISDAGMDQILDCNANQVGLDGSNSSSGPTFSYAWYNANNILVGTDPLIDVSAAANYSLIVIDLSNGCADTSTVLVQLDDSAPLSDAGPNDTLTCAVGSVLLDGGNSDSGPGFELNWYDSNGMLVGQGDQISVMADDVYTLSVTDLSNGCISNSSVEVLQDTLSPLSDAGPDGIINCYQPMITLGGSGSSQGSDIIYAWEDATGNSLGTSQYLDVSSPGIYNLSIQNIANGCLSSASVMVDIDIAQPLTEAGSDILLNCFQADGLLDGSGSDQQPTYSYFWTDSNGQLITDQISSPVSDAGIYYLEILNTVNGCSSLDSMLVSTDFAFPVSDAGLDQLLNCFVPDTILEGLSTSTGADIVYSWTDAGGTVLGDQASLMVNQAGVYYLEVLNTLNGCSTLDSAEVEMDVVLPVSNAGTDAVLNCYNPIINLNGGGSSVGPNITYQWLDAGGGLLGSDLVQLADLAGSYYFVVSNNNNGCVAIDSVMLSADFNFPTANAGPDLTLDCLVPVDNLDAGNSSAGPDISYEWTDNSGQPLGMDVLLPVSDAGLYIFVISDASNGCMSADTVVVTLDQNYPVALLNADDLLTCIQTTAILDASGSSTGIDYQFTWNTLSGSAIQPGADPLMPTVDQPGTYELIVLNTSNACADTVQVDVFQDIVPPVADAGTSIHLNCFQEFGNLDGSASLPAGLITFAWSGTIDGGANSPNPSVSAPGNYSLEITNIQNGCTDSDEVVVTASFLEDLSVAVQTPPCIGESGSLEIMDVLGGTGPYTYSINGGVAFASSAFFDGLSSGTYEVVIQDAEGCMLETIASVPDPILMEVFVEAETTILLGDDYQIAAATNLPLSEIDTIIWTPSATLSCADCLTPVATPLETTDYHILVENKDGCLAEATIRIIVDKANRIYIPNVFSPNHNGLNDLFMIYAAEGSISKIHSFRIYDRWGEKVHEAYNFQPNDPAYGWEGKSRGVDVNPGVFVWMAEIEYPDGRIEWLKGDVTVLK